MAVTRRIVGGRRYGSGRKGTVYNLACIDDKSACYNLVSNPATLTVYTLNGRKVIANTQEFIAAISAQKNLVAKRFSADKRTYFEKEIANVKNLYKVFGQADFERYTTYIFLEFDSLKVIGFTYNKYSYIINQKCDATVDSKIHTITQKNINDFIYETLAIIKKYVDKNYFHGDIKLDNIMLCGDHYKIIDYEHGSNFKEMKPRLLTRKAVKSKKPYGARMVNHPLLQYLFYQKIPFQISSALGTFFYTYIRHSYKLSLPKFIKLRQLMQKEILIPTEILLGIKANRSELFEKYKRSFDTSAFGISILILSVARDLPQKYYEFAFSLINPMRPDFALNPGAAIKNFEQIISDNQMSSFESQFALPLGRQGPAWENRENPQLYDKLESQVVSPDPRRHMLGIVGGNAVSVVKDSKINITNGQQIDIESDLRGTSRPLTFCPLRKYQPQSPGQTTIVRNTTKGRFAVDAKLFNLPNMQMWAYPATYAPEPLQKETCGRPEKY